MRSTIAIISFLALSAHPLLFGEQGARAPEVAATKAVEQASVAVPGTKMSPAMLSEVPFLAQNVRPFRTVSFVMEEEIRGDGGAWYPSRKERATFDLQSDRYLRDVIRMERGQTREFSHERKIQLGSKELRVSFFADSRGFEQLPPSEKKGIYGQIYKVRDGYNPLVDPFLFSSFYYLNSYDPDLCSSNRKFWVDQFLQGSTSAIKFEIFQDLPDGEINIYYKGKLFTVDPKIGAIARIFNYYGDSDEDKMVKEPELEVTKFHEKNGYLFPIEILLYIDGKPYLRQRIDPSTLEINEEYSLSDFILKIPAGTPMEDHINGTSYVAERPFTLQDIKEIESELLALVKKAKNNTQPKSTVK